MQVDLYEILKIISEEKLFCRQMIITTKRNNSFEQLEIEYRVELIRLYNLQKKLITLYRKKHENKTN